ncbi:MAG: tRNA 4-thiouridine(8) synthase ThiI, partial [Atopobiaceae bacterium]|nr:tRNA 4-thiouridine(8) synthase ThiI [Atopobiaceae bacterium]
ALATPQSLRVIMYRRMMFSVAERIAKIEGAKAIVTGESLGQVASQTLENIAAVNECVELPIFRPLIGSDKQEIIARAHQLGTFDICCQTAPDCCTLFMPRRPETHARLDDVHAAWDLVDHDARIDRLVENVEYIDFEGCPSYRAPKTMRTYHHELGPATLR